MPLPFANLHIHRIIIHEVFKKDVNGDLPEPNCSVELADLGVEGLAMLQERIVSAIGSDSHGVQMSISDDGEDSAFQVCANLLRCDDADFIENTAELARKLSSSQTHGRIPGGIAVVLTGTVGANSRHFVGVIKAEIHSGFSKEEVADKLNLRYLKDLLLTPQQRLYKIGILIENANPSFPDALRSADEFEVFVYDHNMTRSDTSQLARYFYGGFLGCDFATTAKKASKDFYYHTCAFIKDSVLPDETKMDLMNSLHSYLKTSQQSVLQVRGFAEDYLNADVRDNYCDFMEEKGTPMNAIPKDLTQLKSVLKRRQIKFSSGIKLVGPAEDFERVVDIQPGDEPDETVLKIKGKIETQG